MKHDKTYSRYALIGLIGLGIQVAVNLVVWLASKNSAAEFFSQQWWSTWFPGYPVWLIFIVIGLVGRSRGKSDTDQQ